MRSLIIIVIFLVFFEQSNAFLVKISKDNHINQPGYITTIYRTKYSSNLILVMMVQNYFLFLKQNMIIVLIPTVLIIKTLLVAKSQK